MAVFHESDTASTDSKKITTTIIIAVIVAVILLCCCCLAMIIIILVATGTITSSEIKDLTDVESLLPIYFTL